MMEVNIDKVLEDIEFMKKSIPGSWIIRHEGKVLTLNSGKSIWKRRNHATAALANHMGDIYYRQPLNEWGFKSGTELAQYLVEKEILKVEQL